MLILCVVTACAFAQPPGREDFNPQTGHPGKDVDWTPTPYDLVELMLDMAKVAPSDYLIDLGSGDGRTVIFAAKRGTPGLGIEYNPDMVALARRNAAKAGLSGRAEFVQGDIFESDFSRATVVTMFLLAELNLKLRPKILALRPGTRVISTFFMMGDWLPDRSVEVPCEKFCVAHLWVVPARVEGIWRTSHGELALTQAYQRFSGTLNSAGTALPVSHGRLTGEEIVFSTGGSVYRGRVRGETIEGTVRSAAGTAPWRGAR